MDSSVSLCQTKLASAAIPTLSSGSAIARDVSGAKCALFGC